MHFELEPTLLIRLSMAEYIYKLHIIKGIKNVLYYDRSNLTESFYNKVK